MNIDHKLLAQQIALLVQLQRNGTPHLAENLEGIICLLETILDNKGSKS